MIDLRAGDKIRHRDVPAGIFPPMPVQDTRPCETGAARSHQHLAYKITDPEGSEDWLCAYDVIQVI